MHAPAPVFWNRPDTVFGVCEALGQDIGVHPNVFRAALGVAVLFAPVAALATYLALGLGVLVSRLVYPVRAAALAPHVAAVENVPVMHADNDPVAPQYAEAA